VSSGNLAWDSRKPRDPQFGLVGERNISCGTINSPNAEAMGCSLVQKGRTVLHCLAFVQPRHRADSLKLVSKLGFFTERVAHESRFTAAKTTTAMGAAKNIATVPNR
jgi:hypothetical protein